MLWYNVGLITLISALVITEVTSPFADLWPRFRWLATLGFKIGAVLVGAWGLIIIAERTTFGPLSMLSGDLIEGWNLTQTILVAALRSMVVMLAATALGTLIGLGTAYVTVPSGSRSFLGSIALASSVVWVIPTFLIAALVQEFQAQVYGASGVGITGGYGTATALSAAWVALVLAIRPAVYVFRQARVILNDEAHADHVRAAKAMGLPRRQIYRRHVLRPATTALASAWISSFRIMIGSLPLVEFFFAYPGLGMQLILALGITYPGDLTGHFQPDLAIGLIAVMAALLMTLEAATSALQRKLDPRLHDVTWQMAS